MNRQRVATPAETTSRFDAAPTETVDVRGATISFRSSRDGAGPTVLFVHGGLAHSAWWAHIIDRAPSSLENWAAMDLSGHGDSQWRENYDTETWLAEIVAVASRCDTGSGCIIVGHSLGGMLSLIVAASSDDHSIVGVVAVDGVPAGAPSPLTTMEPSRSAASYPTLAEGAEHFAQRGARSTWPPAVAQAVGAQSLRLADAGWEWKHDGRRREFRRPHLESLGHLDPGRTALIVGADSRFARDIAESDFVEWAGDGLEIVTIRDAGHDLMMERPAQFVDALEAILEKFRGLTPEQVYSDLDSAEVSPITGQPLPGRTHKGV